MSDTFRVATEMVRVKQTDVPLLRQGETTCCYAKADKFWVGDADGIPREGVVTNREAATDRRGPDRDRAWRRVLPGTRFERQTVAKPPRAKGEER